MTTVCIVTGSEILSDTLQVLIEDDPGIAVAGSFKTVKDFMKEFDILHPDVSVIDLEVSAKAGAKTIRAIKIKHPDAIFLVLANSDYEPQLLDAITAGAKGFLVKNDSLVNIVQNIYDAINENSQLSERLISKLINYLENTVAILLCNRQGYKNEGLTF